MPLLRSQTAITNSVRSWNLFSHLIPLSPTRSHQDSLSSPTTQILLEDANWLLTRSSLFPAYFSKEYMTGRRHEGWYEKYMKGVVSQEALGA